MWIGKAEKEKDPEFAFGNMYHDYCYIVIERAYFFKRIKWDI